MVHIMHTKFDPKAIFFGAPKKNSQGGTFVPLVDATGNPKRFEVQTPVMHMPFGLNTYRKDAKDPKSDIQAYYIEVSFRGMDSDEGMASFHQKMKALDAHVLDASMKNSTAWFGRQKSKETLEDNYSAIVRQKKEQYPPIMKTKVTLGRDGNPIATFFDDAKPSPQQISVHDLAPPGCRVRLILSMDSVWFVNNTFGVTWRVSQCQLAGKPNRMEGFCLFDDATDAPNEDDDRALVGADDDSDAELN
jgi:hypothetical protein